MRPRVGVPLVVFLVIASSWALNNNDEIEQWLQENSPVTGSDEVALLPLQPNERWVVLVVDFDEQPSTEAWGVSQAEVMLEDVGAKYIEQISNNQSKLTVEVSQSVTRASGTLIDYGEDTNGNRDMSADGTFLPMALAEETVLANDGLDWSSYDLDEDGFVDRLLILHTTKGQEENPGQTGKIWSHFTVFEEPIEVSDTVKVAHYTMASLRTGSSGMGTVLHEMMHQMGALDLYPVHDTENLNEWQGVGDWDIMASGNWNGGGSWPALPTASTMEKIGANRSQQVDFTWPQSAQAPCIGPSIQLKGISDGGQALKVPVADGEFVWIEYRSNSGFDAHLPGNGVLVTYQDTTVGDEGHNELNSNPNQPWLRVVEADGRDDILNGVNSGESSDVFTDGMTFGSQGIPIYSHDGILVSWTATIEVNITMMIHFTAPSCTPALEINLPDFGGVMLPGDTFPLEIDVLEPCNFSHQLTLSDGRSFEQFTQLIEDAQRIELMFSSPSTGNAEVMLEGTVQCGEDKLTVKTKILTLNRVPVETTIAGTFDTVVESYIDVLIESKGNGSQSFSVHLDGPMNRIGTAPEQISLVGDDTVRIHIDPQGLLQDRMSVEGELVLLTQGGHTWTVQLEFIATSQEPTFFEQWRSPGNVLFIAGLLSALWVLLGMVDSKRESTNKRTMETVHVHPPMEDKTEDKVTDAWGRIIDKNDA